MFSDRCLLWCILAALYPAAKETLSGKACNYEQHLGKLDLRGVTFPTPLVKCTGTIFLFVTSFSFWIVLL